MVDFLRSDTDALGHVENGAVFGDSIDEGGAEVFVAQKWTPLGEAQLRCDNGASLPVALLDEAEEEAGNGLFHGVIAQFVDKQAVEGCQVLEERPVGAIAQGTVELIGEIFEVKKPASISVVDGLNEECGGESGLAATRRADEEHGLGFGEEALRVIEIHNFASVQFGLPGEGEGLHGEKLGQASAFCARDPLLVTLMLVLVGDGLREEAMIGRFGAICVLEDGVPIVQNMRKFEVAELVKQLLIHDCLLVVELGYR